MAELMFHSYSNLGEYLSLFHSYSNLGEYLSLAAFLRNFISRKNRMKITDHNKKHGIDHDFWHEVPKDIMEMVMQRINLRDRVHLRAVCKAWRSLARQEDIRAPPEIPWLLLPQSPKGTHLSFCNLSEGKIRDIKLPKVAHGGWCCGSSKGWLLIVKETDLYDPHIFLLNPLSGARHQLPSLTTIPSFHELKDELSSPYNVSRFVGKWELSSANTSECTVAAVFGYFNVLACCRPKDKSWTIFQFKHDDTSDNNDLQYHGIVFFDEATLCALTTSKANNQDILASTYTLELPSDHQLTLKLIPALRREDGIVEFEEISDFWIGKELSQCQYLVGSSEKELLMVCRIMDFFESEKEDEDYQVEDDVWFPYLEYYRTCKFEVLKLASDDKSFSKLENLGDRVIFLSAGGSLLLSSRYLSGIRGNCIYFVDDINTYVRHRQLVSRDTGIFYLDDGRIERCFPSTSLPHLSRLAWFSPIS